MPQTKANELYEKYFSLLTKRGEYSNSHNDSIECSLVAVREIQKAIDFDWMEVQNLNSQHRYWDYVQDCLTEMKD